ncbi:MAG: AmmeMemoRadiSam system protein B [Chloroflexi bacterium RBG_13_56_8]|nr:MAG: AmmeMemoRadiSam system protein B [Chloroflexi bacterium RBG_13_56_8]
MRRSPTVAGLFYPADEGTCRRQVLQCLQDAELFEESQPILGGMVPHAGFTYSGPTAGRVFAALSQQALPETIVLFGAVHSWGVSIPSMFGSGSWRTPLGDLLIDEELAQEIGGDLIADRPQAHAGEHSIEVQTPFIAHLFPHARILPIAVPPTDSSPQIGREVARAVRKLGRRAPALGSSDMTHYGPRYGFTPVGIGDKALQWVRRNDARFLDLVVAMCAEELVNEAETHYNACGSGAIAAMVAYAAELGATQGKLLHYTTSHEVLPMGPPTDMVGYGAVVLF